MEVDITSKVKDYVRYGLIGLVVLVLLAGGGVYLYQHHNRSMTVYGAQVAGTLVPAKARSAGKITEIVVSDGDHVNAGDVIARVETNITDEEIQQLQQNLDLSKQSLEQLKKGTTMTTPAVAAVPQVDSGAQQRAAQAYSRLQRMNELFSMGAISAVKRDEAAAEYAAAKAAASSQPAYSAPAQTTTVPVDPEIIKQAEAQVKQAEAALANAKQDQQSTEILAPAEGTVILADGVATDAEVKANQVIVNIMDAGDVWVEAHVTTEQAKNIRLGQFAEYEIDGHKLQGSVKDVADASDSAADDADTSNANDGDGRLTVRISVPSELSFTLKPGMEATIKFVLDT